MSSGDLFDAKAWIVTRGELAQVLGVAESRINQLCRDGMPRARRGRYRLDECVQWVIEQWRQRSDPSNRKIETPARQELAEAQTAYYRVRTEREAGRLVDRDQVAAMLNEVAAAVAGELDALEVRAAPRCAGLSDPNEVAEVIRHECRDARERAANALAALADAKDRGGDPGAAGEPDA